MRSLNDRHQAPTRQLRSSFQSPVTRVKRTRRRDALGIDARTIFAVLPVRPVQPAPTHPSPSARQFRLLLNDLANICAETDVLQRGRCVRARTASIPFDTRDGGPCPSIRAGERWHDRSTPGAAAVAIDDKGETQKAAQ